jgi:hypothetical protein
LIGAIDDRADRLLEPAPSRSRARSSDHLQTTNRVTRVAQRQVQRPRGRMAIRHRR